MTANTTADDVTNRIRDILKQDANITTYEEVKDRFDSNSITIGFWWVYHVAKNMGRKINRSPVAGNGQKDQHIRELALTLWAMHTSPEAVFNTLTILRQKNESGERVPWKQDQLVTNYSWELSIAQELVDLCDGMASAENILRSL